MHFDDRTGPTPSAPPIDRSDRHRRSPLRHRGDIAAPVERPAPLFGSPILGAATRIIAAAVAAIAVTLAATLAGCASTQPAVVLAADDSVDAPTDVERRVASRMAERHFTDGSLLDMRERHAEAIAEYRRALRFDSTRGPIYYAMGRSFRELNEFDSALHYTELALRYAPTLDVHEQMADLLMLAGEVDRTAEQYEAMLAIEPNHLQARYMLARLLQRRDPARAIPHYEFILRNLTDDVDVMLRLAELYLDAGNVDASVRLLERMIAMEPTNADLHRMTTTILLDAERYAEALALLRAAGERLPAGALLESFYLETLREIGERLDDRLRHASSREPADDDSLLTYARELVVRSAAAGQLSSTRLAGGAVALRIGESARAEALFTRALADSLASAHAWLLVAESYLEQADPVTGIRVLRGELHRFADDFRVPFLFAQLHDADGNADSAVEWVRHSLRIYDDNAEAWGMLGRLYEDLGRVGASDAAYEKSIDLDPENAAVLNNFAYSLAQRGSRLDRALELATRALELEPENEIFLDTRGWVHYRRGELALALEYLERAVDAGGAAAEVYEHLGDVHRARGASADARDAYRRALELEPERAGLRERLLSVE